MTAEPISSRRESRGSMPSSETGSRAATSSWWKAQSGPVRRRAASSACIASPACSPSPDTSSPGAASACQPLRQAITAVVQITAVATRRSDATSQARPNHECVMVALGKRHMNRSSRENVPRPRDCRSTSQCRRPYARDMAHPPFADARWFPTCAKRAHPRSGSSLPPVSAPGARERSSRRVTSCQPRSRDHR